MRFPLPPIFFFLIPIVFVAFWCFVVWVISRASGWQRLAAAYPAHTPPAGQRFIPSARVGRARYNRTLYVYVSREGLYLRAMWGFSFGHKPLFIPWTAIHNRYSHTNFFQESVTFEIGQPPINTMQLPKEIFDASTVIEP